MLDKIEWQEQGKGKMARLDGPKAKHLPVPVGATSMCYHTWVLGSNSKVFQLRNKHFTNWPIFLGSLAPFFWHSYIICWPNIYLICLLWFFKLLQTSDTRSGIYDGVLFKRNRFNLQENRIGDHSIKQNKSDNSSIPFSHKTQIIQTLLFIYVMRK